MKKILRKSNEFAVRQMVKMKLALNNNKGEGYVDTAVKILIAVVLGALILAALYALFGNIVLPTLTQRIKEMFDYGYPGAPS